MSAVRETLVAARDLLVSDGWCTYVLVNNEGKHCAVGAVLRVQGLLEGYEQGDHSVVAKANQNPTAMLALKVLSEHVPESPVREEYGDGAWNIVACYNNTNFEDGVLDLFNRTITDLTEIASVAKEKETVSV